MAVVRRVIFWCHLAAGVVAGSIVLILSVTGALLTYEKQMGAWADVRPFRNAPPPGAARLGPDAILAAVRLAHPETAPTALTMWSDPAAPASVVVAGPRTILVNPYTAQVLGEAGRQPRAFFRKMTDWHRWLGVSGEGRATARAITGACNLAFLFLVVSGFYLWFPRTWTWRQVRAVVWFRSGLRGKARDFNWHNAIGLWSAVPLFVVVLSGAVISYPWAGDLVYRAAGETPPVRATAAAPRPSAPAPADLGARPTPAASLDALWPHAERQVNNWRTITARLPASGTAVFAIDRGTAGQPQKRGTLTVNTSTAEIVKWEPFAALSKGRQWRAYLRFAHTGEVAGLAGQTIAGLSSLGGAFLVYTGLSLAIRRVWAWRARPVAAAAARERARESMLGA